MSCSLPDSWLRYLAERAGTPRWGDRDEPSAAAAWRQLDHELSVIAQLGMAGYFLIVHDVCQFAAGRGILTETEPGLFTQPRR
ncbi:hypothetical protein [Streptomyces sp. R41]|uniref:Bacterial DNA polymerase III alpha subunit NTPase domain-containing protein n=1 Tax=Streptomyces sp. R41 TaxID=3238632 RepID=A0AB39R6W5_9ACTN